MVLGSAMASGCECELLDMLMASGVNIKKKAWLAVMRRQLCLAVVQRHVIKGYCKLTPCSDNVTSPAGSDFPVQYCIRGYYRVEYGISSKELRSASMRAIFSAF